MSKAPAMLLSEVEGVFETGSSQKGGRSQSRGGSAGAGPAKSAFLPKTLGVQTFAKRFGREFA
jgi:hypothetical protein